MSKAAIVTGASSGIGLAISRVLCEKGYEVYGFGRDFAKEQTRKFVEQTAAFHPVEGDLFFGSQFLMQTIMTNPGRIDKYLNVCRFCDLFHRIA